MPPKRLLLAPAKSVSSHRRQLPSFAVLDQVADACPSCAQRRLPDALPAPARRMYGQYNLSYPSIPDILFMPFSYIAYSASNTARHSLAYPNPESQPLVPNGKMVRSNKLVQHPTECARRTHFRVNLHPASPLIAV